MTDEERHELVLFEINVRPEYHRKDGRNAYEVMEAANKQALIDLFRHAASRLEKADFFYFDFEFLNEVAIDLLTHKWDSKFQVTLRNLKPSPSTEAPKQG